MFYKTLLALCVLCSTAFAEINVNDKYQTFEPIIASCDVNVGEVSEGDNVEVIYEWDVSEGVQFRALDDNKTLHIWAGPGKYELDCNAIIQRKAEIERVIRDRDDPNNPAKYKFELVTVVLNIELQKFTANFTVEGFVPPTPVDPVDPIDPVDPVDPDDPPAEDDPIAATGFHVLILEETGARPNLDRDQRYVLQSSVVRSTVVDKYGGYFRVTDPDSPLEYEDKRWVDAIGRERDKLPWIIVSNDKAWYEGPLPINMENTLKLLEIYKPR